MEKSGTRKIVPSQSCFQTRRSVMVAYAVPIPMKITLGWDDGKERAEATRAITDLHQKSGLTDSPLALLRCLYIEAKVISFLQGFEFCG